MPRQVDSSPPRRAPTASPTAEIPWHGAGGGPRDPGAAPKEARLTDPRAGGAAKELTNMSEEAQKARQALQESMDLREQGHTDD